MRTSRFSRRFVLIGVLLKFASLVGCSNSTDNGKQPAPPVAAFCDRDSGEKYGFINQRGEVVIKPQYNWATDFVNGLARVQTNGEVGFIDTDGKLKFMLPTGTHATFNVSDGVTWFQGGAANQWGLCDDQGRLILEPTYDDVGPFADGLAPVNIGAKRQFPGFMEGGKWGYVNTKGELVIPIQYGYARQFSGGLARVPGSYIDKLGEPAFRVANGDAGDFREGLAPVYSDRYRETGDWLTRFFNARGEMAFEVSGRAGEFHDGLAVIQVASGTAERKKQVSFGYIDRTGKIVIPSRFAGAAEFSEGLAAVTTEKANAFHKGGSWGYIDKTGNHQIEPQFNDAHPFHGGVARVHVGGTLAVVTDAPPFWRDGEWWLIDARGRKLKRDDSLGIDR